MSELRHNETEAALTPAQERALVAILAGQSQTAAAKTAGTSRQSVSRWVHSCPKFRAALANGRAELRSRVCDQLEAAAFEAVQAMRELLNDPCPSIRLRSASELLKILAKQPIPLPTTPTREMGALVDARIADHAGLSVVPFTGLGIADL